MVTRIPGGRMRHLVDWEELSSTAATSWDTYGQTAITSSGKWTLKESGVRASIRTLRGRELEHARQETAKARTEVVIDYRSGVQPLNQRFVFGNRHLNIMFVDDIDGLHFQLRCLCGEEPVATT